MKSLNRIFISFLFFIPLTSSAEIQSSLPEDISPFFSIAPVTVPDLTIDECPPEGSEIVTATGLGWVIYNSFDYFASLGRPNFNVGNLNATKAGWYHIYRIPTDKMADSGNHQRNEAGFLSVPNGRNPEGKPHSSSGPECNGFKILGDVDNETTESGTAAETLDKLKTDLNYGGTFYLNEGENVTGLHHFCKLQNVVGGCDEQVDRVPTDDPDWHLHGRTSECWKETKPYNGPNPAVNSFAFNTQKICAIPVSGLEVPNEIRLPEPSISNGDFSAGTIGFAPNDWVGSGEDGFYPFASSEDMYEISSKLNSSKFIIAEDSGDSDDPSNRVLHATSNAGFYAAHYLPNDIDKNWTDLSWKNYLYEGRFKLSPEAEKSWLFGFSVYSEFPYSPNTMGLFFKEDEGGTFQLDSINYIPEYFTKDDRKFLTGSTTNNTNVRPKVGIYYRFKIEATSRDGLVGRSFGQTILKAKVWEEKGESEPDYQAIVYMSERSGQGAGFVGVLGAHVTGDGVYVDDLKVTPLK